MKYFLFLILLIGSAKGQALTFDTVDNAHLQMFTIGKNTQSGSWYFIVQDSLGRLVAHQKDGEHFVVEDSGATISVMYKCLQTQYEWSEKQWAKRDSVKRKAVYQKKKYHKDSVEYDGKHYAKKDLPIVMPHKIHKDGTTTDELTILGGDVKLGGALQSDTTINGYGMTGSTITGKAINFDSFYLSSHGLIPKYKDSISIKGYNLDFWNNTPVQPYPWWKKLLWSLFGAVATAVCVFFLVLVSEPKNVDL